MHTDKGTPSTIAARALEHDVLQAVMENAPLPMAQVAGPDHIVWSINPAFCRLLHRTSDQLIGKPFADLFPQTPRSLELMDRVLRSGEGEAHVVVEGDAPNTIYGAFTCWPIQAGVARLEGLMIQVTETNFFQKQSVAINEALLIGAVQQHELTEVADRLNVRLHEEIEERKKAELASSQLAAIVAFSDDAIISKDLDGVVTSWNKGAERIFGYSASEMVGTSLMRLIPADRKAEEDQILKKIRLGQSVQHFETLRQAKDGHLLDVAVTASPIKDASGKVIGASKVARDITVRKQLELALAQTARELAEMDRRKSEFLATLAHELRNPLAPLRNGLELLALSTDDQATLEQTHAMMKRQLDQMVLLIDDLMDLSRINRGVIDLRKERMDLRTILERSLESSRALIERHAHTLVLDLPEEPLLVEGDAMRLTQVFSNLLNNAAKYTDPGGAISVRADTDAEGVRVSVEDNGIGIAPDQLTKVFDMFAQVERTSDRVQGGLGIGLNIVKHLVTMHGGHMDVRSGGLGSGSCFTVHLPVATQQVVPPAPSVDVNAPTPVDPIRILVVDDNEDAATMMAMLLDKLGHRVRVAHDGKQALEEGKELLPDVVLMDLGMPVMDGYSSCRAMRLTPWGARALIVALSGWGQEEDRRRSAEAGFDRHMVKPIAGAALLAVIAEGAKGGGAASVPFVPRSTQDGRIG